MRRMLACLILLFFFPSPGWSVEGIKVGVVDLQRVIGESRAGRDAREKFRAEVRRAESELLKEKDELERLKGELDRKALLLREEEKQELERRFQRRYRDYMRGMQDSQQELRQRENDLMARILDDLREIVAEIGQKESFTLILERGQTLYAGEAVDITERVIRRYDERNGKSTKAKK